MVYPIVNSRVSVPEGTPNGTLFVSVDGTFGIEPKESSQKASLEDCARGYWSVENLRAAHGEECSWLMARKGGKIIGVWRIDTTRGWMEPEASKKKTWPGDQPVPPPPRLGCDLKDVDEPTRNQFIGQVVHLGRCPNSLRGYFFD